MFERPQGGERAILIQMALGQNAFDPDEQSEFQSLATAAGACVTSFITGRRANPDPHTFVGSGKVLEIQQAMAAQGADVVIFDHDLSPSQERNLERILQCRVLSRTGLILDIFAQRARSFEGQLQVELAQLQHLSTRLIRGWTHLERQRGGIGLRGPGETQLETDRRLIAGRIKQIRKRLDKVLQQRQQNRQGRRKAEIPTVTLVGYTNAGKSTLFNHLTASNVLVADQLFATLDPTLRRLWLPTGRPAILADTVGFIRRLPPTLIAAFRATLQEIEEAHLLLHVVDASDPCCDEHAQQVDKILALLGADAIPRLKLFNKIDRLGKTATLERDVHGTPQAVWFSAQHHQGIDLVRTAIAQRLEAIPMPIHPTVVAVDATAPPPLRM